MKKNKLILVVLFFIISCKVVDKDYLIIHSSNNEIEVRHYFHENNDEYARVYGNNIENDSITFSKDNNDLLVNEFIYNQKQKKRIVGGNVRYINYYTLITDIQYNQNAIYINETPIKNLDFLKNDEEIEKIIKENCKSHKDNDNICSYTDCDFSLPQSNRLEYLPNSSKIISVEIKKNKKKQFQEINIDAKYFDAKINYKRYYYYRDKRIQKIKTLVQDSISTDTYIDSFSKINLKQKSSLLKIMEE